MENKDLTTFLNDLSKLNISLTDQQIEQFMKYYDLLVEWNSFMNLTAITEFEEVCKKHFIDSLTFIFAQESIKKNANIDILSDKASLIDVGTGAGFPGIPLKIAFPNLKVTLLDSLNKRVKFLNEVIDQLGLSDIEAVHGRAEDFAHNKDYRDQYDFVVSRAVANMSTLSEYCVPFCKKEGLFIPFKSEKIQDELANADKAFFLLGVKLVDQIDFNLPDTDYYRSLILISKEKPTPKKYPRKAGVPTKEPL